MARTGPYCYHGFARVCSAELVHAEMGGGMLSEAEACQSPKRRYVSPDEFHEFGRTPAPNPTPP